MMNIYQSYLALIVMALSPMSIMEAAEPFIDKQKAVEDLDIISYLGKDDAKMLFGTYNGVKCRYQDLGSLRILQKPFDIPKTASKIEAASFRYLKEVKERGGKGSTNLGFVECSPFITNKKRLNIYGEIESLSQMLRVNEEVHMVASKQEGDLGMSIFLAHSLTDPARLQEGVVALIQKNGRWEPCVTPGSFANINMSYEGNLRLTAETFEQWGKKEASKLKKQATEQASTQMVSKLEGLRKSLENADAPTLLDKLARGLSSRNAMEIASVLNFKDGVRAVIDGLEYTKQENRGFFLDRLSGPRCIIVPLDPKPVEQSLEEKEAREKEVQENGRDREIEQNGEKGQECALGIIIVKPALRYNSRSKASYYLPLNYHPAQKEKKKGAEESSFLINPSDLRPYLSIGEALNDSRGFIQDWELGSMSGLITTRRMARDFSRTYPAYQFKTPEEALAVILPALKEERFTDLLRCLSPNEFTSGAALMSKIDEIVKLTEYAGAPLADNQEDRNTRVAKHFNPSQQETIWGFENVVLYERDKEALVLWKLSANSTMQIKFAHLALKKEGDVWHLDVSEAPVASGLVKIAQQLKTAYNLNQAKRVYANVGVLKTPKPVQNAYFSVTAAHDILELLAKDNLTELAKSCLLLEDSPESRKNMEDSIMDHKAKYGNEGNFNISGPSSCDRTSRYVISALELREQGSGKLREAAMLVFVLQGGKMFWVPELTLFSPTTPVRKMFSNKRLNGAKKFLSPPWYESYKGAYASHCARVEADGKRK